MRLIAEWKFQIPTHKCKNLLMLYDGVYKCICCGQHWVQNNGMLYSMELVYIPVTKGDGNDG
jgi:hypothetical protein